MDKLSLPSIEKFAAYLDGNLSPDEMQQFSQQAEHNEALRQLLEASSEIDDAISGFSETDLQLPPEILGSSFELPEIPTEQSFNFATFQSDPWSELFDHSLAVAASANDEITYHPEISSGNDIIDSPTNSNGIINLSPEDDSNGLGDSDDMSQFTPDGM